MDPQTSDPYPSTLAVHVARIVVNRGVPGGQPPGHASSIIVDRRIPGSQTPVHASSVVVNDRSTHTCRRNRFSRLNPTDG
jgi:hypothetical protein